MAILRTIVWFIYFFGKLLCLTPQMLRAKKLQDAGQLEASRAIVNRYVPQWAGKLMRLAGVTITVNGAENIPTDRSVVFIPNHQSNYDVPLMLTQLGTPPALVAKIETMKIPLVRTWMQLLDCIFLDRNNPRQAMTAMNEVSSVLEKGVNLVIFPEGTRSKGDTMREFKTGAFRMACKAGATIVPVAINGSYKAMEANHNLMCPAHVIITVLPSIDTAALDRAAQKALPEQVAAQIAAYLPQGKTQAE